MSRSTKRTRYNRIKYLTDKVKDYLVNTCALILGSIRFEEYFGYDKSDVPVVPPTATFLKCAHIISKDKQQCSLIPKHILSHLDELIPLRQGYTAEFEALSDTSRDELDAYTKHLHFINVLARSACILRGGLERLRQQHKALINVESTPGSNITGVYGPLHCNAMGSLSPIEAANTLLSGSYSKTCLAQNHVL